MLTQSLNKVLLLSFAHRSSLSHPVFTLGARPLDPKYPSHTIAKSYLSNIPCSGNHSITSAYCPWHTQSQIASFYCPLHTQSLHHILLSPLGARPFDPTYPVHTQSLNHISITSFFCPLHTQSIKHVLNSLHALIVTQSRPLQTHKHKSQLSRVLLSSNAHTITQSQPSSLSTHKITQWLPFAMHNPISTISAF
jgi:hypothetical protein